MVAVTLPIFTVVGAAWEGERGPCRTPERAVSQFILGVKQGDSTVGSRCLGPIDWTFLPFEEPFRPTPYRVAHKITVKRPAAHIGSPIDPDGRRGQIQRGDLQILVDWRSVLRRGGAPMRGTFGFLLRKMEDRRWIILDVAFEPE